MKQSSSVCGGQEAVYGEQHQRGRGKVTMYSTSTTHPDTSTSVLSPKPIKLTFPSTYHILPLVNFVVSPACNFEEIVKKHYILRSSLLCQQDKVSRNKIEVGLSILFPSFGLTPDQLCHGKCEDYPSFNVKTDSFIRIDYWSLGFVLLFAQELCNCLIKQHDGTINTEL